jgi:alanine-glyoxylate transaminase/(R)-3-amino-2-methylpropionate-pyruvate transaminase
MTDAKRGISDDSIETSWDYDTVAAKRQRFLSPSLATFVAYSKPLLLKRGERQYLYDADGKRYLDCLAQNLSISVGYNHPLVSAEIEKQLETLQHCTTMYLHPVPAHFAEELVAKMPKGADWVVHLVNSGAEAIDLAVMMARTFTGRFEILALRNSFHGLHFGAQAATGLALCRQPIPPAPGYLHVANPDQYRGAFGPGVDPYVEEIDRTVQASSPGGLAGFMLEPIQGYGGVIPLPPGYIARSFARAKEWGAVTIVDEVQTGFGRTGQHFWGFEIDGVVPDIVVMGKGIGNGFPLAAVVTRREIAESMAERKFFNTYGSNPMAAAAGRAVLRAIETEGLQANAGAVGAVMRAGLDRIRQKYPVVGEVRGRGLMLGIEIVKDRATRTPGETETGRVHELIRENGVITGRSGLHKNVLRVNPPLCVTEEDAAFFLDAVDRAFAAL